MTQLTLNNWMIEFNNNKDFKLGINDNREVMKFIVGLLELQKDEAVKRIEEDILTSVIRCEKDDDVNQITYVDGLKTAQDIIRSL